MENVICETTWLGLFYQMAEVAYPVSSHLKNLSEVGCGRLPSWTHKSIRVCGFPLLIIHYFGCSSSADR